MSIMSPYDDLCHLILNHGEDRGDRTGTGTRSIFGHQMRFDLRAGFPAITTKRLFWRGVVSELIWFLSGQSNIAELHFSDVHIWDQWADEDGDLGPVYGCQWRSWGARQNGQPIDQIAQVIDSLKRDPESRRHLVSAWNVADLPHMALAPCHVMFQFYVSRGERLCCQLYQRSADVFLGLPFNIASYALLTHMIAQVVGLNVGEFIHTIGDAHIYTNHMDQVRTQLAREHYPAPRLELDPDILDIDGFTADHIRLIGYQSHPAIKAPIAI